MVRIIYLDDSLTIHPAEAKNNCKFSKSSKNDTIRTVTRPLYVYFLFAAILLVIYSPTLCFNYIFHDDVFFWFMADEHGQEHMTASTLAMGRYGSYVLVNIENWLVHRAADLQVLRFVALLGLSACAYLCHRILCRWGWRVLDAFLTSALVFTLPGVHSYMFWGRSTLLVFAAVLACMAFKLVQNNKPVLIPALLLALAISIYPGLAMFYWALVGAAVLFTEQKTARLFAAGIAGVLAYASTVPIVKFLYTHFSPESIAQLGPYNPYQLSVDIPGKIRWLFGEPLNNTLNLWNIFPNIYVSAAVAVFVVSTLWVFKPPRRFLQLIPVFLLGFLPNLIASINVASYRNLFVLEVLAVFVLIWCVQAWLVRLWPQNAARLLTMLLAMALTGGAATTFSNILYHRVLPSAMEWKAFTSMSKVVRFQGTDRVLILLPDHQADKERYDEYGVLSTHYYNDIYLFLYAALHETRPAPAMPLVGIKFSNDPHLYDFSQYVYRRQPDGTYLYKEMGTNKPYRPNPPTDTPKDVGWFILGRPLDLTAQPSGVFVLDLRRN